MSKKFKQLLVPEGYRHYWSKYPEGYTILEALLNWVESVNQLTDNVNDWNIYLDEFVETFDEKIAPTVREMLNEMDQDGRLAEIINDEIFSWKADKTYVDDELEKKADITYVDGELEKSKSYILLSDFEKLPSETDDTERIKRAVNSLKENDKFLIDNKVNEVYISDTILIDKNIDVEIMPTIVYTGTKNKPALHFKQMRFSNIKIKYLFDEGSYPLENTGYHGYESNNYIGVLFENLRECNIDVKLINGFTVGHKSMATNGGAHWFNNITIYRLHNNKIHNEYNCDGAGSWMNSNNFYESSCGYVGGYLPSDFDSLGINLYTILQTNTNGNNYSPNSNNFLRWKFEVSSNSSSNWIQIKINRAAGWLFENYRFEFLRESTFCLIDMKDSVPSSILFKPSFVTERSPGVNHKITFINSENLNRPLSEVAKIVDNNNISNLIYSDSFLNKKYRRITNSYHVIRGYMRMSPTTNVIEETPLDYSNNDLLLNDGVRVTTSAPLIIYLDDLKPQDEFKIDILTVDNKNPNISYKCIDINNNIITNASIEGKILLGIYGSYEPSNYRFVQNNTENDLKFSVNSPEVKKIAVLISGDIKGINIYSNNRKTGIMTSLNSEMNQSEKVISKLKPVKIENSGFYKDDIVLKFDDLSTGWKLDTDWIDY